MSTEKSASTVKPKGDRVPPSSSTPGRSGGAAGTPGRGSAAASPGQKGPGFVQKASKYLGEVRTELRKTTWPTKPELVAQTQVVIGLLVVIGVFIFVWDLALTWIFRGIMAALGVPNP